jgi:acyl carrier protein
VAVFHGHGGLLENDGQRRRRGIKANGFGECGQKHKGEFSDNQAFASGQKRLDSAKPKPGSRPDMHKFHFPDEVSPVASTFDKVADIIADTSEIDRETITPDSHTIDDLGIDSLDFLDIVFAIDKAFGIKIPLEKWTQDVNEGKAPTEEYFVLKNLCGKIDELVAAKAA